MGANARRVTVAASMAALTMVASASAQTVSPARPQPRRVTVAASGTFEPRGYLSINGGYQATANDFSNTWSYDYWADRATVAVRYPVRSAFLLDIGGGVRIARQLMIAAAISHYTRADPVTVTGSIPHPFYSTMRPLSGTADGPSRTETAVHLDVAWMVATSPRTQITLLAGPTAFRVQQLLVQSPTSSNLGETYPYDTVTLATVTTADQTKTKIGFNAGADLTYLVTKQVGVGGLVRYSSATVDLQSPGGGTFSAKAGGVQVSGGVRFRF